MWINIFSEYSFGTSAATPSADSGPVHVFGFFQIGSYSLYTITFLDTCQKKVSTHTPQFRSNLSVAPKLTPIMIVNIQIDLYFSYRWCIKSLFCPSNKDYKYLYLLLRWHFSCSIPLPHLFFKNTSAPSPFSGPQAKHFRGWRTPPISTQELLHPSMASISEIPVVPFPSLSALSLISSFLDFSSASPYFHHFSLRILGTT